MFAAVDRFDAEIHSVKEEVNHEKTLKDKINREKEKFMADKYKLEHEHAVSSRQGRGRVDANVCV